MKILFIGDIFARSGLIVSKQYLIKHRSDYDFVLANGENTAGGFGITRKHFNQLLDMGVDVVTLGNHTWDQQEVFQLLEETPRLLRPLNYPSGTPGLGCASFQVADQRVHVVQIMGRIFMDALDCPFKAMDEVLEHIPGQDTIIVDFHAEATSEKKIMLHHLAGRVSALIGTHTHVQTADETIKNGTAYITDVGMTGPQDSSIGMNYDEVYRRIVQKLPSRYKASESAGTLCALSVDIEKGRAKKLKRIQWRS